MLGMVSYAYDPGIGDVETGGSSDILRGQTYQSVNIKFRETLLQTLRRKKWRKTIAVDFSLHSHTHTHTNK